MYKRLIKVFNCKNKNLIGVKEDKPDNDLSCNMCKINSDPTMEQEAAVQDCFETQEIFGLDSLIWCDLVDTPVTSFSDYLFRNK